MSQGFVSFAEVKRAVTLQAVLDRYGLFESLTEKGQNLVGACPFCKGPSARQFQVNREKGAWYCFGCKQGGNVLDFVARQEHTTIRAAALTLDTWFALGLAGAAPAERSPEVPSTPPPAPSAAPPAAEENLPTANPPLTFTLKTLDYQHASLTALSLRQETTEHFGLGYCAKGLLAGRVAIPIHSGAGELVAYAGLAVDEGASPRYLLPPKFHPALEVFNVERLPIGETPGPLYLAPAIEGVLRLVDAGFLATLGLFDGSLSPEQEETIAGVLPRFEGVILVGEGFADRAIARLARHAHLSWTADLPAASPESPPAPRAKSRRSKKR